MGENGYGGKATKSRRTLRTKLSGSNYFSLDKVNVRWFNIIIMKQINRKNTGNWWWPVG
jgi:hypothetical protein